MPRKRTGIIVIGVLLAASGLAFLRAEQLKLERAPVGGTHLQKYFSTTCSPVRPATRCSSHSALLRFRLRTAGRVALAISDGSGKIVDHLTPASGRRLPRGQVSVRWNGGVDGGGTAADGVYHLRVALLSLHRVITIPDPSSSTTPPPGSRCSAVPAACPSGTARARRPWSSCARSGSGPTRGRSTLFHGRAGVAHFHRSGLTGAQVRITLVAVDPAGNASATVEAGSIRLPA